jgi:hypothetical protein
VSSDEEAALADLNGREAADIAKRYHALKEVESQVKRDLEAMNLQLRTYIEKTGEPLTVEGIPTLKLKPRGTGLRWDSAAIENLMRHKEEWQRLVELGCVGLNASTVKEALKNGNLAAIPEGATEGEVFALVFDRER